MVLRLKSVLAAVVVLSATLWVGACSSSGGPAGSTSAAAAGASITLGVECSCSGPFGSTVSQAYLALQAWAKSVNATGGLNGHTITLIEKDNGSVAGTALADAQALVSAKVDAIIDLDILDAAWQKLASGARIPVIGGNFSSPMYYQDPDWYPSGQTNDSITYSVAATAKQAGATNLADFYCAESVQCQESVPLIKAAGQSVGVPVVYSASIAAAAPNYTAQCLAAKQAGVKAIFVGDSVTVIDRVAGDCDQQGYDPIFVTEGTGFQDLALTVPGLKDTLWSSYPILPYFSSAPAVARMNAVLDKYAPGIRGDKNTWSEFAAQGWTAGLLVAEAVKNSGASASDAVTPALITDGLGKVSNDTLGGFSPALTFSAGKAHPVDCWYVGRVHDGVASQVGGLTCQKSG